MAPDVFIDPESISLVDVSINAMTEAYTMMKMPAKIELKQHENLRCNIDTGATGNSMPHHVFIELFPRGISAHGKPTSLFPSNTHLTVHN